MGSCPVWGVRLPPTQLAAPSAGAVPVGSGNSQSGGVAPGISDPQRPFPTWKCGGFQREMKECEGPRCDIRPRRLPLIPTTLSIPRNSQRARCQHCAPLLFFFEYKEAVQIARKWEPATPSSPQTALPQEQVRALIHLVYGAGNVTAIPLGYPKATEQRM
eukprot:gene24007-biopygen1311